MGKLEVRIPLFRITDEPHIVGQHGVNQKQFDFIGGEEPSGTGVTPVTETQTVWAHAHELVQRRLCHAMFLGCLSKLVES